MMDALYIATRCIVGWSSPAMWGIAASSDAWEMQRSGMRWRDLGPINESEMVDRNPL